jgi:AcrR family transcriptional regulator
MATQGERRAHTRQALLDAAAELFAARGVEGASVDAIAEAADRTSGAVYDHFGLEGWVDDVATVTMAELSTASTLEERMAVLWRNVADPVVGDGHWIALEHELWRYATRNEDARQYLARRYRTIFDALGEGVDEWTVEGTADVGPALIGLLLGLEMMRRVAPDSVPDDLAVGALCGVVSRANTGATPS